MEIIKFIFSDFWIFIGFLLIFGAILNFIYNIYSRTLKYFAIHKHGYQQNTDSKDKEKNEQSKS